MKKKWSARWESSVQPRKQRKFRANAPLHARKRLISAHLNEELRKRHGRRAVPLRKGDQVEVMRGSASGTRGAVSRVDTKRGRVYIDGVKSKKRDGSEVMRPIAASNVMIYNLILTDKKRTAMLSREGTQKKTAAAKAPEKKAGGKA